jgi:hypothetical protein
MMKKLMILSVFLCCGLLLKAQDKSTLYLTKPLANASIRTVQAETSGGSLSVIGVSDEGQARIEVYVNANNGPRLPKDEIEERLKSSYQLSISTDNNQLTAIARPKPDLRIGNKGLSISFKIYAPVNIATKLNTNGGGIHLENLTGDQQFHTSGGGLHIEKVSGQIKGNTSGGGIELSGSRGDIDLHTSGGGIDVDNCNGKIHLVTSGGGINADNCSGEIYVATSGGPIQGGHISGSFYAHTSGGGIHLRDLSCDLDAGTSGGGMNISIASLKKYVKLDNSGGNISLQLPKDAGMDLDIRGSRVSTTGFSGFSGQMSDSRIDGKLNGGGTAVTADCGGNVSLSVK